MTSGAMYSGVPHIVIASRRRSLPKLFRVLGGLCDPTDLPPDPKPPSLITSNWFTMLFVKIDERLMFETMLVLPQSDLIC